MIKDELKERKMTQKQLAEQTGIKASVLSETINGKRSVSLNVAVALTPEERPFVHSYTLNHVHNGKHYMVRIIFLEKYSYL